MKNRIMTTFLVGFIAFLLLSSPAKAADGRDAQWLQKARQAGLSLLRKKAYEQIAELRVSHLALGADFVGFDFSNVKAGSGSPANALYQMGLKIVPVLVEALNDTTPTMVVETDRRRVGNPSKTWKVNELAALLIVRLTQRNFVMGDIPNERVLSSDIAKEPVLVPQFKKKILDWYAQNRNKTFEDRKIADVSDEWFRNRLDAVEWLGQHKVRKANSAIVRYINKTLASERNSLHYSEMAESALALGQIGTRTSLPVVRSVCQYLGDDLKKHGQTGSMDLYTLFQAYQGRALLGEKADSIRELKSLVEQSSERIRPSLRKGYKKLMEKAAKW